MKKLWNILRLPFVDHRRLVLRLLKANPAGLKVSWIVALSEGMLTYGITRKVLEKLTAEGCVKQEMDGWKITDLGLARMKRANID